MRHGEQAQYAQEGDEKTFSMNASKDAAYLLHLQLFHTTGLTSQGSCQRREPFQLH